MAGRSRPAGSGRTPPAGGDLAEFEHEFQALGDVLSGRVSKARRGRSVQASVTELCGVLRAHPDRFCGFGNVPLDLSAVFTAVAPRLPEVVG